MDSDNNDDKSYQCETIINDKINSFIEFYSRHKQNKQPTILSQNVIIYYTNTLICVLVTFKRLYTITDKTSYSCCKSAVPIPRRTGLSWHLASQYMCMSNYINTIKENPKLDSPYSWYLPGKSLVQVTDELKMLLWMD